MKNREEYVEVDLLQILKVLWKKAWVIILVMIVSGGMAFAATKLLITPQYNARILMYVNNKANKENQQSISQGDLAAAKGLVETYRVILRSQSTLDEIIKQGNLPHTPDELDAMITSDAINSTGVFYVEVTGPDPKEAAEIANVVGQVLPSRISAIVDGSSVRLLDYAQEPTVPSSPNVAKNAILGAVLGTVIACVVIIIKQLTNDKISGPDYLVQNYQIPVLAVIPDLEASQGGMGYYQGEYSNAGKGW